jgi:hypothetical protein
MRLSFQSRLVISRFLCCTLRTARHLSVASLFWLKNASSGRGALAGTRCAHLNCNDEKTEDSVSVKSPREDQHHNEKHRSTKTRREDGDLPISQSPRGGASGAAVPAAMSRMLSRSPAPRAAGSRAAKGGSGQLRSPSRGPISRHLADEAASSGSPQLLRHGTVPGCQTR